MKFNFCHSNIKLEFVKTKEGRINLLYCGLKDKRHPVIKSDLYNYYPFIELGYVEDKNGGYRSSQQYLKGYGLAHQYVSHKIVENDRGKELILVTRNEDLEVETHYLIYHNCNALSSYNIVKNIAKKPINLTYISSFHQLGVLPINDKNAYVHYATNGWYVEAQWECKPLKDVGLFAGLNYTSMKRFCLNNNGTWSTKEFLPMMVLENRKKKTATLVQIENNGSWHLEIGDCIGQVYLAASGPELLDNSWLKILKPGETFESVHATLSFAEDFEGTIQEITKARRIMRRDSLDHKNLPVIFNDYMHALWDTQTTDAILPLVDIASEVGSQGFCIDAGWFAVGNKWWTSIGEWKEEPSNFPNGGFKGVIDYIKSKGMFGGMWIEIEEIGINSPILKDIKDDWFFQINGEKILVNNRYQLNFANEEVYQHALDVIDRLVNLYHIDYLKIDYNVDFGIGNSYNSDSLGDGLLKHNRAYIKWLNEVMDKYPNLTIENCASGGCRMDAEILKYCPIQSTSDQVNYRLYPYIATNVFTICPPEQAAVWSYPLNDMEKIMPTDEVVAMNMCNAMLGRIHLASFINKLPNNQLELIKEGIRYYKSLVEFKKNALPIYPIGTAKYFGKEVVGGLKNGDKIVLGVWNTSNKPRTVKVKLEKYHATKVQVGYPKSLGTKFEFDKETKVLSVTFDENYGGRIFEIEVNE